jgi:hypothetical protein
MSFMDQIRKLQAAEGSLVFVAEGEHILDGALIALDFGSHGRGTSFDDLRNIAIKRHALSLRFDRELRLDLGPQLDLDHLRNSLRKQYHKLTSEAYTPPWRDSQPAPDPPAHGSSAAKRDFRYIKDSG